MPAVLSHCEVGSVVIAAWPILDKYGAQNNEYLGKHSFPHIPLFCEGVWYVRVCMFLRVWVYMHAYMWGTMLRIGLNH